MFQKVVPHKNIQGNVPANIGDMKVIELIKNLKNSGLSFFGYLYFGHRFHRFLGLGD